MLLNYLNLWLYKQIPCHSFRIPTLKVIKSENFNIFCFTIFVYNSYTKGCKIHPRITTFYGIIFSPVFCRNFLPKPSEFCCTKKGRFLHHDGICRYLYHHTLFHQNFPPPGSHSGFLGLKRLGTHQTQKTRPTVHFSCLAAQRGETWVGH